jgi:5-methyltetrahydropteroyltriglutamate--homocysteine methyltransferase
MKLSSERILTTHVGSLPRPADMIELLVKKEAGQVYEKGEFDRVAERAVADIVRKQAEIGIDVVSDGEMSKFGYATYIKDRLEGFGSESKPKPPRDMADYPELRRKMYEGGFSAASVVRPSCCVGDVRVKDSSALEADLEHFRKALDKVAVAEGFLNAASPGVVTAFQMNKHYPSQEAYVFAVAEAMRAEYEAIVGAGFILQLDCPDLAMSRHTAYQDMSEADFLRQSEIHVEALNTALANVPAEAVRLHVCWGNYEGPHDFDIALEKILPIISKAKPQALVFEAANARHEHEWAVWRDARLLEDKILVPGVIDSSTNYVEHPDLVAQRILRYVEFAGQERVIAGTDCGFGTFAGYSKVDPQIAFKKLASLVEGARRATERKKVRRPQARSA